jgi:AAA+ ATPase superfamily predicted ATPase
MTRNIQFEHEGENIDALLVYNFESFSDAIGVIPLSSTKISPILFFEGSSKEWSTDELTSLPSPLTFRMIVHQLEYFFKAFRFSFKANSSAFCEVR